MSTRNMSQFRDNSWLSNARSYGVLKSLRCSARYAKCKSKSAINLNAHLKQQQKKQKSQQQQQQQQQQTEQVEALYSNIDELIQTEIEDDALMGNAQVSLRYCIFQYYYYFQNRDQTMFAQSKLQNL